MVYAAILCLSVVAVGIAGYHFSMYPVGIFSYGVSDIAVFRLYHWIWPVFWLLPTLTLIAQPTGSPRRFLPDGPTISLFLGIALLVRTLVFTSGIVLISSLGWEPPHSDLSDRIFIDTRWLVLLSSDHSHIQTVLTGLFIGCVYCSGLVFLVWKLKLGSLKRSVLWILLNAAVHQLAATIGQVALVVMMAVMIAGSADEISRRLRIARLEGLYADKDEMLSVDQHLK